MLTSPDSIILLIVDYYAAIGGQDHSEPLCTPLTALWAVYPHHDFAGGGRAHFIASALSAENSSYVTGPGSAVSSPQRGPGRSPDSRHRRICDRFAF